MIIPKKDFFFSESTLKKVRKIKLDRDIITLEIETPNAKKEIKRVFQMVNRRLQNIRNADVLSPAAAALGVDLQNTKFTQFSVANKDWNTLKIEYAKCISFLQNPTSTAQGAKQWTKTVQNSLGFSNETMTKVIKNIKENKEDFTLSSPIEHVKEEFETVAKDISDQIERDAKAENNLQQLENELQKDFDDVEKSIDNDLQNVLNSFKNFKL